MIPPLFMAESKEELKSLLMKVKVSLSVMYDSLWSHGLFSLPGSSLHGIL